MRHMPSAPDRADGRAPEAARSLPLSPLAVAGFASIGAGAIHAAAIGMHSEHTPAVVAFALTAAFQLGWGVIALTRANRVIAFAGVAVNGLAIVAWIRAKSAGVSFIEGLEEAESVQLADGVSAALAAIATIAALLWLLKLAARRTAPSALMGAAALVVVAMTLTGMIATGSHSHAGDDDHGAHGDEGHGDADGDEGHVADDDHAVVPPKPYDPTKPIDLGGVEGVTLEQQARAENLLAQSLIDLPQFADPAVAEANGFYSIGDASTGDEHYINWSYVNDPYILDPDHPESLVYRVDDDGQKFLAAAMFMLPDGTTLDQVPDLGGPLTQWHVHNDLCFTDDPVRPTLAFGNLFVSEDQECTPPSVKKAAVPMIHVWITPHPCGPFAALEGVGAGHIREGEERLCDTAHGSSADH